MSEIQRSRYRGCLLGGAIGDTLGEGWIAKEALAIAVYCCLKTDNIRKAFLLSVNHDGDSNSTGAIVGNLLGAMHGLEALPLDWLEILELREVIDQVARDLFDLNHKQAPLSGDFGGRYD